jgi:hypothetical protein
MERRVSREGSKNRWIADYILEIRFGNVMVPISDCPHATFSGCARPANQACSPLPSSQLLKKETMTFSTSHSRRGVPTAHLLQCDCRSPQPSLACLAIGTAPPAVTFSGARASHHTRPCHTCQLPLTRGAAAHRGPRSRLAIAILLLRLLCNALSARLPGFIARVCLYRCCKK